MLTSIRERPLRDFFLNTNVYILGEEWGTIAHGKNIKACSINSTEIKRDLRGEIGEDNAAVLPERLFEEGIGGLIATEIYRTKSG